MSTTTPPRTTMNGKPVFSVAVKTILNLHSGFEHKLLCDGPTFSTGDACVYRCAFCYVPAIYKKLDRIRLLLEQHGLKHGDAVIRREHALDVLRGQLAHPNGKLKFNAEAERGRVVYSSPAVDVAGNMELVRETVAACAMILGMTPWKIRLLSKSNLLPKVATQLVEHARAKPDCGFTEAEVYERMIFGVSTGTLDDGIASAFEQAAPLVSKRIASLHWLQDQGFATFGMICPSLPQAEGCYPAFAKEMAEALRADRCQHVYAEVINLRGESFTRTEKALRDAGHEVDADALRHVSTDAHAWEAYNRATFEAHATIYAANPGKLRYLTYTTAGTVEWWRAQRQRGAVLL